MEVINEDREEMEPISLNIWDATELGLLHEVEYWHMKNPKQMTQSTLSSAYPFRRFLEYLGPDIGFFFAPKGYITPLYIAAEKGYLNIVRFFWTEYTLKYSHASKLWKPIKWTLFNKPNDLYNLQKKIQTGTEEYYKSLSHNPALMPLNAAAMNGHLEIIQYFLSNGFSINSCDDSYVTALHTASAFDYLNVVEYLLQLGAEVDCKDDKVKTPLTYAVSIANAHIVKILIESGADVNHVDIFLKTPFQYAANNLDIAMVQLLLDNDAIVHFNGYPQPRYYNAIMAIRDYRNSLKPFERFKAQLRRNTKKVFCVAKNLSKDMLVLYWLIHYYELPYDTIILVKKRISYYASFFKKLFLN